MRLLKFRLNKTELSGDRVESDQSPVVPLSNLAPLWTIRRLLRSKSSLLASRLCSQWVRSWKSTNDLDALSSRARRLLAPFWCSATSWRARLIFAVSAKIWFAIGFMARRALLVMETTQLPRPKFLWTLVNSCLRWLKRNTTSRRSEDIKNVDQASSTAADWLPDCDGGSASRSG